MRILLTGAQGFIGRYLAVELLNRFPDAEVLGVGRSSDQRTTFTHEITVGEHTLLAPLPPEVASALDDARYRYRVVDINQLQPLTECLRDFRPTVIVHLAGALRGETLDVLLPANVQAIETLFDAIIASGIPTPHLIHGSSGSVYGRPAAEDLPVTEEHPAHPFDDYSISKSAGELVGAVRTERLGASFVRARIFNVVGPGQDERHIVGRIAAQVVDIELDRSAALRLGTLTTTRDFVDVRDVAGALATLVANPEASGIYNIGTGRETAMSTIVQTMTAVAGHDELPIDPMPPRPDDNPRICADITRITSLGHTTMHSLEASCRDVLAYYRSLAKQTHTPPQSNTTIDVRVDRRDEYRIHVAPGVLDAAPNLLARQFPGARVAVLSDDRVWQLYGRDFCSALQAAGLSPSSVVVPAGDASKSLQSYETAITELRSHGIDRHGVLIALGGGMICDLGGFVASSYLRGIKYVNIPTTLLAQCDAAIGGKVAVNAPWAKNFIGSFHHPSGVLIDPHLLQTLDRREIAAGVAEIIKVAIITDPVLFADLETNVSSLLDDKDPEALQRVLLAAGQAKIDLLAPDPYEADLRRVLNFGHTYAHPLETELAYSGLLHGEAVAWGMLVSSMIAEHRGLLSVDQADRIVALITNYGLPPDLDLDILHAAVAHLAGVRLVRANKLHFVLPTAIGATTIVDEVDDHEVLRAIGAAYERVATSAARVGPSS